MCVLNYFGDVCAQYKEVNKLTSAFAALEYSLLFINIFKGKNRTTELTDWIKSCETLKNNQNVARERENILSEHKERTKHVIFVSL